MKKLLALLLTVVMLLGTSALAEGKMVMLGNVVLYEDEVEIMDLSSLAAVVEVAREGNDGGINMYVSQGESELCSIQLAMVGQQVVLQLNANGVRQGTYYVDLTTVFGMLGQGIDASLMQRIFSEILANNEAMNASMRDSISQILSGSYSDGGAVDIDGQNYQVTLIDISSDQIQAIMETFATALSQVGGYMTVDAEEMMDALNELGIENISVALYESGSARMVDTAITIDNIELSEPVILDVLFRDTGESLYSFSLKASNAGESYGADFDVMVADTYDASWLPRNIRGAMDILKMQDIESALMKNFTSMGQALMVGWLQAMAGVAY